MTHPQEILTKTTVHAYWDSEMKLRRWRHVSDSPYPCLTLEIAKTHGSVCDLGGTTPTGTEFRGPTVVWLEEGQLKDIIEQYEEIEERRAGEAVEEKAVAEEVA